MFLSQHLKALLAARRECAFFIQILKKSQLTVKDNSQQSKVTVDQKLNKAWNQRGHSDTKPKPNKNS